MHDWSDGTYKHIINTKFVPSDFFFFFFFFFLSYWKFILKAFHLKQITSDLKNVRKSLPEQLISNKVFVNVHRYVKSVINL